MIKFLKQSADEAALTIMSFILFHQGRVTPPLQIKYEREDLALVLLSEFLLVEAPGIYPLSIDPIPLIYIVYY